MLQAHRRALEAFKYKLSRNYLLPASKNARILLSDKAFLILFILVLYKDMTKI